MHLLQFFAYSHLPDHLQEISRHFHDMAHRIFETTPENQEQTTAIRKLLEAKDCAVRAVLFKKSEVKQKTPWGASDSAQIVRRN